MWPSAVALSSWLIANPTVLYNKQIIELGAGCGLTGLVASRIVDEFERQTPTSSVLVEEKVIKKETEVKKEAITRK